MNDVTKLPTPSDQREFLAALVAHGRVDESAADEVGRELVKLQTHHRWLCAVESVGELTSDQQQSMEDIERAFEALADTVPGVNETQLSGDARGSTLRVRFEDGHSNSFTGMYGVPTDHALYARLENGEEPCLDFASTGPSRSM